MDALAWLPEEVQAWPRWARLLVAALPFVVWTAVVWQRVGRGHPVALAVAATISLTACLAPRTPLAIGAMADIVAVAILLRAPVQGDVAPFMLVLMGLLCAIELPILGSLAMVAASVAVLVTAELAGRFDSSFVWSTGITLAWLGGVAFRSQFDLLTKLRAAQADLAEQAARDERRRIAHDLHDVIAHSLAVTMLHVTAARLALRTGDADDALAALDEAETQGRASLADVRRTVGLLAEEGSGAVAAPQPGANDLAELVTRFEAAGVPVGLTVVGDLTSVPQVTGLGLYGITREALTNAARHAPGARSTVTVEVNGDGVRLQVCTVPVHPAPATSNGRGMGLTSMRDRAIALGGRFRAGPEGEGWLVEAVVPRVMA